jgi:hypothetical protein
MRQSVSSVHKFINFKKAYDSMRREILHNILIYVGELVKIVEMTKWV